MSRIRAEKSDLVDAEPARVYAVFSDYRDRHPRILPPQYFKDLVVEEGGQGAGTIFRVRVGAMGSAQAYRMVVSEPAPGRVLVESDLASDLVTTFTVDPVADGRQSRVTIATEWTSKPGLAGFMEKLITPPVMRRIFASELRQLADTLRASAGEA